MKRKHLPYSEDPEIHTAVCHQYTSGTLYHCAMVPRGFVYIGNDVNGTFGDLKQQRSDKTPLTDTVLNRTQTSQAHCLSIQTVFPAEKRTPLSTMSNAADRSIMDQYYCFSSINRHHDIILRPRQSPFSAVTTFKSTLLCFIKVID